ncbi:MULTISPECIES: Dabb family protein [unclassified Oceanispirochaeta]|uniref:Dabb family protein n=1 Tax=unclassified Oceanispirochaeta TaxID=2635722 RepID=UPI000E099303|nr:MULTISPECIES: Dabb family protein [unclassified Oceanispirochaeta]MBF9016437.1 Dabb family protein [Oceanispirochaeta sp. M2]NPD72899.1 Dabb family protein [Oceanispirochaeta sp. M1]RDG31476.1 Dabb family protein [Oceanispirochaeta sp. M1]
MVKHVVMWTLKDKDDAPKLKAAIENMKGKVPSMVDVECGINYNLSDISCDLVLISVHRSKEDLDAYQDDSIHGEVKKIVKAAASARYVVDFEF